MCKKCCTGLRGGCMIGACITKICFFSCISPSLANPIVGLKTPFFKLLTTQRRLAYHANLMQYLKSTPSKKYVLIFLHIFECLILHILPHFLHDALPQQVNWV